MNANRTWASVDVVVMMNREPNKPWHFRRRHYQNGRVCRPSVVFWGSLSAVRTPQLRQVIRRHIKYQVSLLIKYLCSGCSVSITYMSRTATNVSHTLCCTYGIFLSQPTTLLSMADMTRPLISADIKVEFLVYHVSNASCRESEKGHTLA